MPTRVVSVPSVGLFLEQDEAYRESVLPLGVPTLAITAGLKSVFRGLQGPLGDVVCLERFGASANFKVLDQRFGYTPEAMLERAKAYLASVPARAAKLKQIASALV